jgi:beta-phosphoglucomutase family hydrolase
VVGAVIFDMDGVIIDSEPFHFEVNKRLFAALGITVSTGEYEGFIGVSNTAMWTAIKAKHGLVQSVKDLVALQVDGNIDFMNSGRVDCVPGVLDLINGLKKERFLLGLASSSPYTIIEMVLNRFGIRSVFDCVVSGEDFKNGKPAPDIFLKTAQVLNVPPAQCVVIEDATHGVQAAKAAGMKCIGFNNPNSPGQDLAPADMVVGDLKELSVQRIRSKF